MSKSHQQNLINEKSNTINHRTAVYCIVCFAISIVTLLLCILVWNAALRDGAQSIQSSYERAYSIEKISTYEKYYQKYFALAEEDYHVSNQVSINISGIRETALLEVLKVTDTEYVVENSGENKNNITSWLEVPGEGIYVVNLEAAEIVIDDENKYILIRLPAPELVNISIDYGNVKKLLFENDLFNDSNKVGEDLARKQLQDAELMIKKTFSSNQYFYESAKRAAISTVECLIKKFNPGIDNLVIEIDFFD